MSKNESPIMVDEKSLVVVLSLLWPLFMTVAHDQVGHQSAERTLSQLPTVAYWVGMSKDVCKFCSVFPKC